MTPEELKKHLASEFEAIKAKIAERDEEIKGFGEAREETGQKISDLDGRLQEIGEELKDIQGRQDELGTKMERPEYGAGGEEAKSVGQRFAESEQYKSVQNTPQGTKIGGARMPVGSFFGDQKSLTTADSAILPQHFRLPGVVAPPDRTLFARDLIPSQQTNNPAVEFVQETGFTNAAAMVAEGALKPESDLTFALVSVTAKVIAHHVVASRQILSDAAMLQAYVNNRLLYGLKLKEDSQLLYGDGTGENLQGLLTHPDVQTYLWSSGANAAAGGPDTKIDAVRRAMTLVTLAEYEATGVILHPSDWEDIELLKGSDERYLWIQVTSGGEQRFFRVPVAITQSITAGQFATGAFTQAAQIYDVWQAGVALSDQHADFFLRNQVAVRGEERLALAIYRPEGIVKGTFDSAPA